MDKKKIRYHDIINNHPTPFNQEDTEIIQKAYVYGAKKHKGQLRLSGEPYFSHPVSVAEILTKMDLDSETIAAGLLHDVVEDAPSNPNELEAVRNEIQEKFGDKVLNIVLGVTKISKFQEGLSRDEKQAENYKNMIINMVKDPRVILVKLADRLHNMRTLSYIKNKDKQVRIAKETLDIYVPIAHRLGIRRIKSELEDMSFQYIYPEQYKKIVSKLLKRKEELKKNLKSMEKKVGKVLKENNIKANIKSRIKKPYSIYTKIKNKGVTIDDIFDLLALRIITKDEKTCFDISTLIKRYWVQIPTRYRDFISNPKPNNYQAIHLTVIDNGKPYEIQIRSEQMDSIAEKGIAAHYYYKAGRIDDENLKKSILYLREAIKNGKKEGTVEKLKDELKQYFITVITPKGDFITMPKGHTVLDFAYLIHSNLGNNFKRAFVNNSLAKASRVLNDWDYVKIITDSSENPKKEWLHFVKSSKARNKIKEYLNRVREKEKIKIGKKLVQAFLNKNNLEIKDFKKRALKSEYFKKHKIKTLREYYKNVGTGESPIDSSVIYEIFPEKMEDDASNILSRLNNKKEKEVLKLTDDDKMITPGKCCNPVKGEPIIGYITKQGKIRAHSQRCKLIVREILNPKRIIHLEWDKNYNKKSEISLKIISVDVFGVLYRISKVFLKEKINITKLKSESDKSGNSVIKLNFEVNNILELKKIEKQLKRIKEITEVERIK